MLSLVEKIVFILIALGAMGASFITFRKMFRAIGKGVQPINWKDALFNFPKGIKVFISQETLFKTRPIIGFIHALVAWGFTLYLIVNIVDVLYGFIPGFHFFSNYLVGKLYRLFVDFFTVMVLIGVIYFLVRRFIFTIIIFTIIFTIIITIINNIIIYINIINHSISLIYFC